MAVDVWRLKSDEQKGDAFSAERTFTTALTSVELQVALLPKSAALACITLPLVRAANEPKAST